jgi:hypothetical protein
MLFTHTGTAHDHNKRGIQKGPWTPCRRSNKVKPTSATFALITYQKKAPTRNTMKAISFALSAFALVASAQDTTLCKLYGYYSSNGYEILNNLWGKDTASAGSQCTFVDGVSDMGTKWHSNWTWTGAPNNVKSYVYAGRLIDKRPVSQYTNLQTEASWAYDTTNIRCNVAYDLFTAADVNHTKSSGDYELMIWSVYPPTRTHYWEQGGSHIERCKCTDFAQACQIRRLSYRYLPRHGHRRRPHLGTLLWLQWRYEGVQLRVAQHH